MSVSGITLEWEYKLKKRAFPNLSVSLSVYGITLEWEHTLKKRAFPFLSVSGIPLKW